MFGLHFRVDHVHDGDTLVGELDQGLGVYQRPISVRLAGVDAAELGTPEGASALVAIQQLVAPGEVLEVESVGWDKYAGRIDAAPVVNTQGVDVVAAGLAAGWLRPWSGRGAKPW